jgi:hypothetical protein
VLKVNPLSLVGGTLNAQYERALNKDMSMQVGLFFSSITPTIGGNSYRFSGLGFTPEYRYYFGYGRKGAPRGLFVGPYLRYSNYTITVRDDMSDIIASANLNSIGGGLVLGYQLFLGDVLTLEALLGPGLAKNNLSVDFGEYSSDDIPTYLKVFIPGLSPILFRAAFIVGFSF